MRNLLGVFSFNLKGVGDSRELSWLMWCSRQLGQPLLASPHSAPPPVQLLCTWRIHWLIHLRFFREGNSSGWRSVSVLVIMFFKMISSSLCGNKKKKNCSTRGSALKLTAVISLQCAAPSATNARQQKGLIFYDVLCWHCRHNQSKCFVLCQQIVSSNRI